MKKENSKHGAAESVKRGHVCVLQIWGCGLVIHLIRELPVPRFLTVSSRGSIRACVRPGMRAPGQGGPRSTTCARVSYFRKYCLRGLWYCWPTLLVLKGLAGTTGFLE